MKNIKDYWAAVILIISIIVIAIALIAQYLYNILPCKMCLYQRYPYYILIFISLLFFIFPKNKRYYFFLIEILLIIGLAITFWHLGIENNFIKGPGGCSSSLENIQNADELKTLILKSPIIACNEVNWTFLGISMVLYNFLLQLVLLTINTIIIFKKNG
mgnify:CR=1 FL=1|tara:strand:+ start:43 stop:519 length:477 start_codon:yes stop_codon:yes gene_type:complete